MRDLKLSLPRAVEQRLRRMGEPVMFLVVDNAAVALQIMKITGQVVATLLVLSGILFQFQQAADKIFGILPRFIDKIFLMPFSERGQRDCPLARQRFYPVCRTLGGACGTRRIWRGYGLAGSGLLPLSCFRHGQGGNFRRGPYGFR